MAYYTPGVYIEEKPGARTITPVPTSITGFIGIAPSSKAPKGESSIDEEINSWDQFKDVFVGDAHGLQLDNPLGLKQLYLAYSVKGFFDNGGSSCYVANIDGENDLEEGLEHLGTIDDISLVVAPGFTKKKQHDDILRHCAELKDRFAILDLPFDHSEPIQKNARRPGNLLPPASSEEPEDGDNIPNDAENPRQDNSTNLSFTRHSRSYITQLKQGGEGDKDVVGFDETIGQYGACYFPWLRTEDTLNLANSGEAIALPPSGYIAGIYAATDTDRGEVYRAPANKRLKGNINSLCYRLAKPDTDRLNPRGINCIRHKDFKVWGARTLAGDNSGWRYVNVRRLFIMIEESIMKGTDWVVFEPNNETLWKRVELTVEKFLYSIWKQGALIGAKPEEAYFVKCDRDTNKDTVEDGEIHIWFGLAPARPAEFVIFKVSQSAMK
jgi:phage tail sheath protein FI